METIVGMAIMAIFMSLFTSALLSMFNAANKASTVNETASQLNIAFGRLDKQVRYAAAISPEGQSGGAWYVEFLTTNTGTSVCSQLKLDPTTQLLQERTWTVPAAGAAVASGWSQLANNVTNGGQSATSPDRPFQFIATHGRGQVRAADHSTFCRGTQQQLDHLVGQLGDLHRAELHHRHPDHRDLHRGEQVMTIRRIPRPVRARLRRLREDSERGSLPMLMLVITVGLSLASLLIPVVLSQSQGTRNTMTKVRSLHAAEAGTDIALGAIRAANNGATTGDTTKLPCGPMTGTLNSTTGTSYQVTLDYYVSDPTGQSAAWLSSNKMRCSTGYGTYDPVSATSVPKDAILTSVGTSTIGNLTSTRTLVSTYVFQTSTATTNGGVIRIYPSSTPNAPQMCMDVGSSPPSAPPVVLQPCSTSTPPSVQQTFSYNADLSIQLVASTATVSPNGLCLDSADSARGG